MLYIYVYIYILWWQYYDLMMPPSTSQPFSECYCQANLSTLGTEGGHCQGSCCHQWFCYVMRHNQHKHDL